MLASKSKVLVGSVPARFNERAEEQIELSEGGWVSRRFGVLFRK